MSEARWYVIDKHGQTNLAGSRVVAAAHAVAFDISYPKSAPHRAVQLVDAAELEQANRRIAELEAERAWQPIETAPKDGALIFVRAEVPEHSRWGDDRDLPPFYSLCAWHPDAGFCVCELRQPTHWQALPEPPKE